jgi:hypothetical protein
MTTGYTGVIDWRSNQLTLIEEIKMFKNRFLLVLSVVSLLLVSMAISSFRSTATSSTNRVAASDFYQRHPNWTWAIPVAEVAAPSDYFQRHPELTAPSVIGIGASDYFQRHPELVAPASKDLTDYYFRQQAQKGSGSDLTDYYFRHIDN